MQYARRYVDILGVSKNEISTVSSSSVVRLDSGMLEKHSNSDGTTKVRRKVALADGSSTQGKARRASSASNSN